MLYNDDDSSRRPGSVFAIRTELFMPPVTELAVASEHCADARELPQTTKDVLLSPPEDGAHSHCCEEVVASFIFPYNVTQSHVEAESEAWRDVGKVRERKSRKGGREEGERGVLDDVSKNSICAVTP